MHTILYVDDEPELLAIAEVFLERFSEFRLVTLSSAKEALEALSIQSYDVIVSDYLMPGMDGIAFLKEVRRRFGDIPFILFTEKSREEVLIDAIDNGADFYLQKGGESGVQFAELAHKIRQAIKRKQAERSLQDLERRLAERKMADEAIRTANRQLALLNGVTRHDIMNKTMIIHASLRLAEKKSVDPGIAELFRKIKSSTEAIQSQIEFTRIYQDLGTQEPQWIEIDKAIPRSKIPSSINLDTEINGLSIYADPMLEKVFFNLIDNSIRHGEHVTAIRVSSLQSERGLIIVWEDNGVGIPADGKEKIFERGFGRNTGLGLFLVREILSLTGATIRESGIPGEGARFEIKVPEDYYRITAL